MLAWLLKTMLSTLLLPPGNGLLLLGVAAIHRRRRWAYGVALLGGILLFVQSLPLVGTALMGTLESRAGAWAPDTTGAQAIVVLGSGLVADAPEYGGDTASDRTLVRTRYGNDEWNLSR